MIKTPHWRFDGKLLTPRRELCQTRKWQAEHGVFDQYGEVIVLRLEEIEYLAKPIELWIGGELAGVVQYTPAKAPDKAPTLSPPPIPDLQQ